MLWSLAVAAVLLVAVVAFALRSRARVLRVLAPMALTTLVVVAALQAAGVSLDAVSLDRADSRRGPRPRLRAVLRACRRRRAEQRRTLHAVLVCSLSTLLVFALLATSSLPVLRAIGLPVAIGVCSNFFLALLLTRVRPQI